MLLLKKLHPSGIRVYPTSTCLLRFVPQRWLIAVCGTRSRRYGLKYKLQFVAPDNTPGHDQIKHGSLLSEAKI